MRIIFACQNGSRHAKMAGEKFSTCQNGTQEKFSWGGGRRGEVACNGLFQAPGIFLFVFSKTQNKELETISAAIAAEVLAIC